MGHSLGQQGGAAVLADPLSKTFFQASVLLQTYLVTLDKSLPLSEKNCVGGETKLSLRTLPALTLQSFGKLPRDRSLPFWSTQHYPQGLSIGPEHIDGWSKMMAGGLAGWLDRWRDG